MPDADLDLAVPGVITGMRFTRQGQSCFAGTLRALSTRTFETVIERVWRAHPKPGSAIRWMKQPTSVP